MQLLTSQLKIAILYQLKINKPNNKTLNKKTS